MFPTQVLLNIEEEEEKEAELENHSDMLDIAFGLINIEADSHHEEPSVSFGNGTHQVFLMTSFEEYAAM
ncbi:hypothetical protein GQ457_09G027130 [Hibiscus cannabinus]